MLWSAFWFGFAAAFFAGGVGSALSGNWLDAALSVVCAAAACAVAARYHRDRGLK